MKEENIVKIISEHNPKNYPKRDAKKEGGVSITRVPKGMKRVMAIVKIKGVGKVTRHINI